MLGYGLGAYNAFPTQEATLKKLVDAVKKYKLTDKAFWDTPLNFKSDHFDLPRGDANNQKVLAEDFGGQTKGDYLAALMGILLEGFSDFCTTKPAKIDLADGKTYNTDWSAPPQSMLNSDWGKAVKAFGDTQPKTIGGFITGNFYEIGGDPKEFGITSAQAPANTTPPTTSAASPPSDNTNLYIGLGVGAMVIGVLGLMVFSSSSKKKSKK